jgi:hypothetical protein
MKTVTIVLNGYKRYETLARQIDAIKGQTYPIEKIMYWNLMSENQQFKPDYALLKKDDIEYAETSHDYGVWGRFTFALNATTDFICIIDDDIIPGIRYIENCVSSYEAKPGIYGTMGSVFQKNTGRWIQYGWRDTNNKEIKQVNYLYQTWFFPREALHAFWSNVVPEEFTKSRRIGEDIHISLMAQKWFGIKTYLVPHPSDNKEFWGNTSGEEYGIDEFAVHLNPEMQRGMIQYLNFAINNGMEVLYEDL